MLFGITSFKSIARKNMVRHKYKKAFLRIVKGFFYANREIIGLKICA
jgi:hypothetical protein